MVALKELIDRILLILLIVAGFAFTGYLIDGVYYYSYGNSYPVPLSLTIVGASPQTTCTPNDQLDGMTVLPANSSVHYSCTAAGLILQLTPPPALQPVSKHFKFPAPITTGVGLNLIQVVAEYKTDEEDDEDAGKMMSLLLSNIVLPPADPADTSSSIQFMTPVALKMINHFSDEAQTVIGISLTALIGASLLLLGFWGYSWHQNRQAGATEEYQNLH